jgi:hypothetical protein
VNETTPPSKSPTQAQQVQAQDPSIPATTTFQQDLTTAGQRHINVMWERTQQLVAIMVSSVVTIVCSAVILMGKDDSLRLPAFMFLTNVSLLVINTYFQRTNHTKTGGVGPHETTR